MAEEKKEIIEEYEDIIKKIKDIVSAKIITDENGRIEEIHVLASSNRSPKQIVRDIESAIMAKYGSHVDHKKISIAQINGFDEFSPKSRLVIGSIDLKAAGPLTEARVTLVDEYSVEYQGVAKGAGSATNRLRLLVSATLNAVEQYLNNQRAFAVEEVMITKLAKQDIVVVGVSMVTGTDEEILTGVAVVKKDLFESIVKATLCAVNRKISGNRKIHF